MDHMKRFTFGFPKGALHSLSGAPNFLGIDYFPRKLVYLKTKRKNDYENIVYPNASQQTNIITNTLDFRHRGITSTTFSYCFGIF